MFYLVNKSSGFANLNLHTGAPKTLKPMERVAIGDEVTPAIQKYYKPLLTFGLVIEGGAEKQAPVPPKEEEVVEESKAVEVPEEPVAVEVPEAGEPEVVIPSFDELMKLRHAELVALANKLGHEVDVNLSKKEIANVIRNNA